MFHCIKVQLVLAVDNVSVCTLCACVLYEDLYT